MDDLEAQSPIRGEWFPLMPYWKDMSMDSLLEIEFYGEASNGFIADVYATGDGHPPVRNHSKETGSKFLPSSVILTVARITEDLRHCKKDSITVFNAVCFDHTMGFIRLSFNSGLTIQVRDEHIYPGCSIEVVDHDIIWNQPNENGIKRAVMFVKSFNIRKGPVTEDQSNDDCTEVTPEHSSAWIHTEVLNRVMKESLILFCDSFKHERRIVYWAAMSAVKIGRGIMIEDNKMRTLFHQNKKSEVKKRTSDLVTCQCLNSPFCLEKCVLIAKPLISIDEDDLYFAVLCRLGQEVEGNEWQNLSLTHKRWCYYWYYAVNVFHMGTGDNNELPACFVAEVRSLYPDPKGKYTGYKKRK